MKRLAPYSRRKGRIMVYIHERAEWPEFEWNSEEVSSQLAAVRHKQGRLLGRMGSLGFNLKAEASLQTLTEEVVKSSEIEGEILTVTKSARRSLGNSGWTSAPLLLPKGMLTVWSN